MYYVPRLYSLKEFTDTVYVTFNVRGYAYGTVQATSEDEMSK